MLSRRVLLRKGLLSLSCTNMLSAKCQHATTQSEVLLERDLKHMPMHVKKKPKREPFMKNLFCGKFDGEVIYFPEAQSYERYQNYLEWMKSIEKYVSETNASNLDDGAKNTILERLTKQGVLRACLKENLSGMNLSEVERAYLLETLSSMPWMGTYLAKNNISPIELIEKFGTDTQKAKYLPRIGNGELIPAICIMEGRSGPNLETITSTATRSESGIGWDLAGQKIFVTNGLKANLFIVFARCSHGFVTDDRPLTAFIVERNFGGVNCKECSEMVGRLDTPVCTITFDHTPVPDENMLGDISTGWGTSINLFMPGRQRTAPQCIATLKSFLNVFIPLISKKKHLDQYYVDAEIIKRVVAEMVCSLYTMESMLYVTTGIEDMYEGQDMEMERGILESYCARTCVSCIYKGLEVLGMESYLRSYPYIRFFEDALAFTTFEGLQYDADTYVALLGLRHAGSAVADDLKKRRNPFMNPMHILLGVKQSELQLNIIDYLHPSLKSYAEGLETCIDHLYKCTKYLLLTDGAMVSQRSIQLHRLAEIATGCYALTCVLSRSSRAYCDGMRHSAIDVKIANFIALKTLQRVNYAAEQITLGGLANGDELLKTIAETAFENDKYFPEHPLIRNL